MFPLRSEAHRVPATRLSTRLPLPVVRSVRPAHIDSNCIAPVALPHPDVADLQPVGDEVAVGHGGLQRGVFPLGHTTDRDTDPWKKPELRQ